jgi:hypothetical protein
MSARGSARLAQLAGLALALGASAGAQAVEPAPAAAPPASTAKRPPAKAVPGKDVAAQLAADDELLEFLGGADGELDGDGDWLDFLASTDIRKLAGARK